jgi:fructose-bisphosphate aldolase class I
MANASELSQIARAMVAPGKGILAADESSGTIKRRFDAIGVESTEANRRDYRELLFRTPGASEFISGVILYDETIRQNGADGTPLVKVLQDQGIIPGIKVDKGAVALAGSEGELVTEGLDGLRDRFKEYYGLGARFSKWRAVITIGETIPSNYCIQVNAAALGRYAALSQEAGIVPIVEPEVLMDGDHSLERCLAVTKATLLAVFEQLHIQNIQLDGMVLKPNMVLSGNKATNRAPATEVAKATVDCFLETVPAMVPGIAFLSGGQADDEATINLHEINVFAAKVGTPWQLTYSFGRGLQAAPLSVWGGDPANVAAAQEAFLNRCIRTSAASQGNLLIRAS